jgi:hypothetical protein
MTTARTTVGVAAAGSDSVVGTSEFSCLIQTVGRAAGNGMTFVTVKAPDALVAEGLARRLAESRFGCPCEIVDVEPEAARS